MTLPTGSDRDFDQAKLLLEEYSFELSGFQAGELVAIWQERLAAEPSWIRSAVLEALYQGRYKAFSVEQILQGWKRRGYPMRHFTSEFERVVFGPIDPTFSKYGLANAATGEGATPPPAEEASTSAPPAHEIAEPLAADPAIAPVPPPAASPSFEITQPPAASPTPTDAATTTAAPLQPSPAVFPQPAPIRQFVPESESSEFYQRLQSVAKQSP
ncbi:MAG TPA: hypothetical protein V6D02_03380 [Candidatus Obscuribacterales bacterium]